MTARYKPRAMEFIDPQTLSTAEIESGNAFAPRFGPDGLIFAIATDTDGAVLMAAWMNAEALSLTLSTGEVHYFSRSRKALWKKGETSGEVQKLIEMRVDCDQDVLWITVEQTGRGAACHTGRKSCFYRRVELKDGRPVLADLGEAPLFDPKTVYRD